MMPAPAARRRRNDREEPLDFAVGERCRRLVHHDDPRRRRQRFRDFDELLLPDRKLRNRNVEGQLQAELVAGRAALARRPPPSRSDRRASARRRG